MFPHFVQVVAGVVELPLDELTHRFWEFQWSYVSDTSVLMCSLVLFVAGVLCSAGGIGGGGIYVAVLMLAGGLSPHNAVPLSKAVVFFGSVSSFQVNLRRLRGQEGSGVIDWNMCRLIIPGALVGTYLGVMLNYHVADYAIVVFLTVLLAGMTVAVSRTAYFQYTEEVDVSGEVCTAKSPHAIETGDSVHHEQDESAPLLSSIVTYGNQQSKEATQQHQDISLAWVILLIVIVSGVGRFHVASCREELSSSQSWGACAHPIIQALFIGHGDSLLENSVAGHMVEKFFLILPVISCIGLAYHYSMQALAGGKFSALQVMAYQGTAFATGIMAGLLGIGGGLIFSPFFLLTGMEPGLAVGTSSTCVLFTSSSTTFQYMFTDRIINPLALLYGAVTLGASFTGTTLVHYFQDHMKRRSFITMIVAAGVATSALLSAVKFVVLYQRNRDPATASVL
mmetsp:Transcript_40774/g.108026  ORF Transcript_40774/g.108026 Transcript_40774/m.108026 type:complete len:452 (-) Transcript_40774:270-1625(-)